MWNFLAPPAHKQELPAEKIDSAYKSYRWQVFLGIFIGYAGFYIVRKNFSMAIPELAQFGFEKGELSIVLSMNAVAYALSKFLMGSVSDRSNARVFLPLGLVLAAVSMMFMIVPVQFFGPEQKSLAIIVMAVLNFLVGWFNGMGWPPCGRVMTHWFSVTERGTMMSIYNPQIQISAESGTKRSIFRQKNKTKRSKKRLHTTLIKPEQKVNEDLCSGFILS